MYTVDNDDQFSNLIHNLATLRRRHGLSIRAMAEILHTTPYALRMLERGQLTSHLYVNFLFHAQNYFHISIRDLFAKRL